MDFHAHMLLVELLYGSVHNLLGTELATILVYVNHKLKVEHN